MCGMMSPRHTPYSSIESAVEVSRSLSHQCFGTRKPIKPFTVSQLVILLLMILKRTLTTVSQTLISTPARPIVFLLF